jgi:hypothetical protein
MTYTPLLKPPAGGTGTSTTFTQGSVVFTGASGGAYTQDNANLFWDDTNNRLGVRTATPGAALDVSGADALVNGITIGRGGGSVASNTAVGASALGSSVSTIDSTAVGVSSLANSTNGPNTAVGARALQFTVAGANNVAVGDDCLRVNVSGNSNTSVGSLALYASTGSQNTAIGESAGSANNGSQNTFVGSATSVSGGGPFTNSTALGYSAAIFASNQIQLGNGSISSLRCQVALTVVSDARDKTDVETLPEALPLLADLRPVKYRWDNRDRYEGGVSDGSKKDTAYTVGFLAQELQQAQATHNADWLNVVYAGDPEHLGVTHERLFPVVVKACQELAAKVAAAETRADAAEARLAALEAAVAALQVK